MNNKNVHSMLKIDSEYYVFISGAIISIPITLLTEIIENYKNIIFWIALIFSLLSSVVFFKMSLLVKEVQLEYKKNLLLMTEKNDKQKKEIWEKTIVNNKFKYIVFELVMVASFLISILSTIFYNYKGE